MTDQTPGERRVWMIVCLTLLVFFSATRFFDLTSRPLHHDEGVNGVFVRNLMVEDAWKYDPQNYHGPLLFYVELIPVWINTYLTDGAAAFDAHSISGLTPAAVRAPIALAGMIILGCLLLAWPLVGTVGAVTACVLAGFSCDLLFFSRDFIHEIFVVLFTLTMVLSGYRYALTKEKFHAYIVGLSAVLLFCTKETAVFHYAILAGAYVCAATTRWYADGKRDPYPVREIPGALRRGQAELGVHMPIMFTIMVIIWMALFTSFFKNWRGPLDSIRTYFFWSKEGVHSGHVKPFLYYMSDILFRYETALTALSLIGILAAFGRNEMIGLYLAYWLILTIGLYSVTPYKTPWLIINFIPPMALLSGYGVQSVIEAIRERFQGARARVPLAAFLASSIFLTAAQVPQTFSVVYKEYDNDKHPQVYAHTVREIFDMLAKIDVAAAKSSLGHKMTINIFSDVYWPLPFYLLKYQSALFWGKVQGVNPVDAPVLIATPKQREEVDAAVKDIYVVKSYMLRPGVPLLLYVNTNLSPGQSNLMRSLDLMVSQPTPTGLKPGMRLEVFKGASTFAGTPEKTIDGDTGYDFSWDNDEQKPYRSPFSFKWSGYVRIDKVGQYKFALESDDGSWLTIDDTPVIDNGGDHAVIKLSRAVNLSAGYHKIELKYFDLLGGAVMHFTWAPPSSKEVAVPADILSYKP